MVTSILSTLILQETISLLFSSNLPSRTKFSLLLFPFSDGSSRTIFRQVEFRIESVTLEKLTLLQLAVELQSTTGNRFQNQQSLLFVGKRHGIESKARQKER